MKLQHLEFLSAVVECGGVGKAAKRLHISQPAISVGLKTLERELGAPLFERVGRRLVVTPRTLAFHQHAVDILRQCEAARTTFRTRSDRPPRLRLGVLTTISGADVSSLTEFWARRRPDMRLQLWEGDQQRLAHWLRAGRIDAAWTIAGKESSAARILWREPFVALVGRGHRLAERRPARIRIADLDGESMVMRSSCELKAGRLSAAGISMRTAARAQRDDLALRLVAQGIGVAIAPRSLATRDVVALGVTKLGLSRAVGLKWRPDLPQQMVDAIIEAVSSLDQVGRTQP
ncbi:MAG TPA: LysR family transcriptional regulator [Vineibacter sp.]|nr:LysR family transcriptional regulator [Vineibacter sp.]